MPEGDPMDDIHPDIDIPGATALVNAMTGLIAQSKANPRTTAWAIAYLIARLADNTESPRAFIHTCCAASRRPLPSRSPIDKFKAAPN